MLTTIRRRISAMGIVLAVMFAAMATVSAQTAHADGGACIQWVPKPDGSKVCVLYDNSGGGGGGGVGSGVGINCVNGYVSWHGSSYPCDINGWSFSGGCYIQPVSPQPPATDPIWGSNDPSTSRVQWEDCTNNPPTTVGARQIVGPCVGACGGPNPVQTVTNQLSIAKPNLGMSPDGTQPGKTAFVKQNIWFWSRGLDTSTQTRTAGNVVGTRTFTSADWVITVAGSPTPVATLHCTSDNEYSPTSGLTASPDPQCGYQFTKAGVYTITVTTTWSMVITQNGVPSAPQTVISTASTATITIIEGQSTNG